MNYSDLRRRVKELNEKMEAARNDEKVRTALDVIEWLRDVSVDPDHSERDRNAAALLLEFFERERLQ